MSYLCSLGNVGIFVSASDSTSCIQGANSAQPSGGCDFTVRSALCQPSAGLFGSVHVCLPEARLAGWWSVPSFSSHLSCAIRVIPTLVLFRVHFPELL